MSGVELKYAIAVLIGIALAVGIVAFVKYLIDHYEISYAPSASVLKYCLEKEDVPGKSPLLVGVADENVPLIKEELLKLERLFAGREKFEGYRIWIKTKLSDFIWQTLSNPQASYTQFFDRRLVERMVTGHSAGTHNYLNEINKVLTVELIYSSLLKS